MNKVLLAAVMLAMGTVAQAGVATPYADDFQTDAIGNNVSVSDWNTNGKVDVFSASGNTYVGLDGGNGDSKDLWQYFSLTKGVTYVLSFDLAGPAGNDLNVSFGKSDGTFSAGSTSDWNTYTLFFTPNKTKDFLVSFANGTGKKNEMYLDNINLAAVPEPETYAMMLAGLGIVGFMARRRRS